MDILTKIRSGLVYFDGGTGTVLQAAGLRPGELPETWNISRPEQITALHKSYLDAGCDIIKTNTFGANRLKFAQGGESLEEIVAASLRNARRAVAQAGRGYVALDIGPSGKLLQPLGELAFDDAVELFAEVVRLGCASADLVLIETISDTLEAKAALLAAKENCSLPVFVTVAFDEKARLLTGADPAAVVALLEGLGADAIGLNCGLGPEQMKNLLPAFAEFASVPLVVNPNAGLPRIAAGKTVFDFPPDKFAAQMREIVARGGRIIGGCCGTTPEHMKAMIAATRDLTPPSLGKRQRTLVSSYTHAVEFGPQPLLIGERINPTGKKRFKQALRERDLDYILRQGLEQQEAGAHLLDVNVGLPEIDEPELLTTAVRELQSVLDLPLAIDTADPAAMEQALRAYNGAPLVNSVNGKEESLTSVLPLLKKYGGAAIALTLDESGIPETAEGRLAVARKICAAAERYGVDRQRLIFDALTLPVSAEPQAALETLRALKLIKEELGCHTSLGVSNVSFGLPERPLLNAGFFALALAAGLDAAIVDPHSLPLRQIYYSYRALAGLDAQCAEYIDFAAATGPRPEAPQAPPGADGEQLRQAVIRGRVEQAAALARELLADDNAMSLINNELIPALDTVGRGFEQGSVFLPQLLMSAEAAKASFEIIKERLAGQGSAQARPGKIVIATVKGDIHDIGKNIVRLLLANYGFDVLDLGKDVAPEQVAKAAVAHRAPIVMLSALMTTTVPAMAETILLLRGQAPWCRVAVGGAVLNEEYARMIGADFYGRDAMASVRYAEQIIGG